MKKLSALGRNLAITWLVVLLIWWMGAFSPFNGTKTIEWTYDGMHHTLTAGPK
jgi:hypothetical protein